MNREEVIKWIRNGNVVALPTETVYGLAASIDHPTAIQKIFTLKKRPQNNPLIVHVADAKEIRSFATVLPAGFEVLEKAFWPGPLTLVLPIDSSKIPSQACAGLKTAAFRIPSFSLVRELIRETGPLVMPSANLSGKPSPTRPEHVFEDFGKDFPLLDGGICECGVESTVMREQQGKWEIIRLGCLSAEVIGEVLGYLPSFSLHGEKPACPGQLHRHYAPSAKLYLTKMILAGQVVIGYIDRKYPEKCLLYSLGSINCPEEVMRKLYATLRKLDEEGVKEAFVDIDIPDSGLWKTIRERLIRASQSSKQHKSHNKLTG